LSRKRPAFDVLEAAPNTARDDVTEELVRRTISESGARGLPETSKQRIKRGLEKLRADTVSKPGGTPVRKSSPKGLVLALVCAAATVLVVPLWVLLCLGILGAIGAMVVLRLAGTERVSGWVLARYARLKDENPEKAERLRLKAARLSAMVSAIAARLPESWVQGLYLPDFEPAGELPEKMRSEPFERLSV
jgi:hypothetical protein